MPANPVTREDRTMITDLLAFLNARLAEAKTEAIAATPGPWEFEGDDPTDDEVYSIHNGEHGDLIGQPVAYTRGRGRQVANGKHIARYDPARALRKIASTRKLIAEIVAMPHLHLEEDGWYSCSQAVSPWGGEDNEPGSGCIDESRAGEPCDCGRDRRVAAMLGAIAEWDNDHPDYRQEWEVEGSSDAR